MILGQRMHDFAGEKEEMGSGKAGPGSFCKKQKSRSEKRVVVPRSTAHGEAYLIRASANQESSR